MMVMNKMLHFFSIKDLYNELYGGESYRGMLGEEREKLQAVLLDMYCDLKKGCEKYGIRLAIAGGSALGQVRHGGFIPWDDDLDTSLPRSQYMKFIRIFDREFGDRYILKAPNYYGGATNRFAQVFKKGTVYESVDSAKNSPKMIYIDIFPLDYVPENAFLRKAKGLWCNFLMAIAGQVSFRETLTDEIACGMKKSLRGRFNLYIKSAVGKVFSYKNAEGWFGIIDRAVRYRKKTELMTSATGRYHYFGEILPRKVFFPVKKSRFAERDAYVYNHVKEYLVHNYGGDYMELPPEEKRESHFIKELRL